MWIFYFICFVGFFFSFSQQTTLVLMALCTVFCLEQLQIFCNKWVRMNSSNSCNSNSCNCALPWTHVPQTQCNQYIDFLFNLFNGSFFSLERNKYTVAYCASLYWWEGEKNYLIVIPSLKSLILVLEHGGQHFPTDCIMLGIWIHIYTHK